MRLERPGQYTDQVHKGKYCYAVLYDHLPLAIAVREIEISLLSLAKFPHHLDSHSRISFQNGLVDEFPPVLPVDGNWFEWELLVSHSQVTMKLR